MHRSVVGTVAPTMQLPGQSHTGHAAPALRQTVLPYLAALVVGEVKTEEAHKSLSYTWRHCKWSEAQPQPHLPLQLWKEWCREEKQSGPVEVHTSLCLVQERISLEAARTRLHLPSQRAMHLGKGDGLPQRNELEDAHMNSPLWLVAHMSQLELVARMSLCLMPELLGMVPAERFELAEAHTNQCYLS